jgi:hypothetical protein
MSAPRPIDFSIPQGRIGAPIRKGHPIEPKPAQPERVVIDKDIHVLLTIRCEGAPPVDVAFAVSASLGSLHQEVATVVGGDCFLRVFSHGALLWESAPQSDGAAARDDAQRSLQSVGVQAGGKLLAVCTPAEAVRRVHAADAQRDAFDGRRTFEQEDELEWRRRNARPMRAQRASGSLADYSWGFAHIEALPRDPNTGRDYTTPPFAECQALLEALAADPGIQVTLHCSIPPYKPDAHLSLPRTNRTRISLPPYKPDANLSPAPSEAPFPALRAPATARHRPPPRAGGNAGARVARRAPD